MGVRIKKLHEDAVIPRYAHEGDSGFDLVAVEDIIVEPGETVKVPIGLAFEIPRGYELQIRPRSGITSKTKLRVQFGTVDSGYRGAVAVTVDNIKPEPFQLAFDSAMLRHLDLDDDGKSPFIGLTDGTTEWLPKFWNKPDGTYLIRKGDRIAQGVIAPVGHTSFEVVDELSDTERGVNGFGSTGVTE